MKVESQIGLVRFLVHNFGQRILGMVEQRSIP